MVERWPAELGEMAGAFNAMLDRLEAAFPRLSQFSADLAHELRTPIGNLRGEAEVALARNRTVDEYQQILASSLEEYDRLARTIDGLLFLARADRPEAAIERLWFDALHHTPPNGAITLELSLLGDGSAQLDVRDTGPGIAPQHLPRSTWAAKPALALAACIVPVRARRTSSRTPRTRAADSVTFGPRTWPWSSGA